MGTAPAPHRPAHEGSGPEPRPGYLLLAAGVIVAATLLRLLLLPREALDGDEVFSRDVSVGPFGAGFEAVRHDLVHPPLHYLALRGVLALLGDSTLSLRALSLAAGTGLLLLGASWTRQLTGSWRWATVVALLLALSPLQLMYSGQARGYALYAFLVLAAAALLSGALRRPESGWAWAGFSLAATAAALTHYVAALYLAFTLPAVLLARDSRRAVLRWAAAMAAPAALLLAWLASVWPHYRAKGGLDINMAWVEPPRAYQVVAAYAEYSGLPAIPRGTTLAAGITAAVVLAGLAALKAGRPHREGPAPGRGPGAPRVARSDLVLLAVLAVAPPLILFGLAIPPASLPIWGARHLLPSHAFWIIGLVLLVREVGRERRRLAGALAASLVALQALALVPRLTHATRVPYHELAGYLRRQVQPGMPVFTTSPHNVGRPVDHYLEGPVAVNSFAGVARSPRSFWLLYRPVAAVERAQFDSLVSSGWQVDRRAHFGGEWGTTAVLLSRR